MSIREEFEKAIEKFAPDGHTGRQYAIWGARWMADYLMKKGYINDADIISVERLAKELQ